MNFILGNNLFSSITSFASSFSHGELISALLNWKTILVVIILAAIVSTLVMLFLKFIWFIESFIFGILEAFEYIINTYLGINQESSTYMTFLSSEAMEPFMTALKAITVVSIVLMLIFTIFAIIKQEYNLAASGFDNNKKGDKNNKKPIILKLFRNFIIILVLPFALIMILLGVNSVLGSFRNAISGGSTSTIATQVLASSTYDANRYRNYAIANKRYPIIIKAYDTSDYDADESDELTYTIQSEDVQDKLYNTAYNLTNNIALTFDDCLTYSAGKLVNSSKYADYYESFICTSEQYQVMADFIDYAELTNTTYYIKSINDPDVDWKYVNSAVYDETNQTLTISYYNYYDVVQNGEDAEIYEIVYTPSVSVTSPISDSLKTIMALLGIGDYESYTYNELERDSSSVNVVSWATEKVCLHFSSGFDLSDPSTWTASDEIIMFEYYRYSQDGVMSSNNIFYGYDLADFGWDEEEGEVTTDNHGVLLDAQKLVYREYYSYVDAYSEEKTIYCVNINGYYYTVYENDTDTDGYGNNYYNLLSYDSVNFLDTTYRTIAETGTATIKLSTSFVLNNTGTWSYSDQVLMYEYYKNSSYTNTLRKYTISELKEGVEFTYYTITNYSSLDSTTGESATYILINDTYYQVTVSETTATIEGGSSSSFLTTSSTTSSNVTYYYTYDTSIVSFDDLYIYRTSDEETTGSEKYELTFSENFNYTNVSTWTYKDAFICYLYAKYLNTETLTLNYSTKSLSLTGYYNDEETEFYVNSSMLNSSKATLTLKVSEIENSNMLINVVPDVDSIFASVNFVSLSGESIYPSLDFEDSADFVTSASTYTTFTFSEDVIYENVQTWTVQDFLLFLLDEMGVITPVDDLSSYEYNAVVYTANDVTYYRFGTTVTETDDDGTITVISDTSVYFNTSIYSVYGYSTLESFLNANFCNFLIKYISSSITNSTAIISADSVSSDEISDISGGFSYECTATRSELIKWKISDFFIKYITGNTTELTETYTSYEYTINGLTYVLIDDYYILEALLNSTSLISLNIFGVSTESSPTSTNVLLYANSSTNSSGEINSTYYLKTVSDLTESKQTLFLRDSDGDGELDDGTLSYSASASTSFDASDYSTWTLTDFLVYSLMGSSFQSSTCKLEAGFLVTEDEYGSVTVQKVLKYTDDSSGTTTYVSYSAFTENQNSYVSTVATLTYNYLQISFTEPTTTNYITLTISTSYESSSFQYNNYYYYKTDVTSSTLFNIGLKVSSVSSLSTSSKTLLLKLSDKFSLSDLSTWTVLDYIIVYEYSVNPNNNIFKQITSFSDFEDGVLCTLYYSGSEDDNNYYLVINGNYYYLKDFETTSTDGTTTSSWSLLDGSTYIYNYNATFSDYGVTDISNIISIVSAPGDYTLKVLSETVSFYITADSEAYKTTVDQGTQALNYISETKTEGTTVTTVTTNRVLDTNTYMTYQLILSNYPLYSITDLIREVNWPQKLMNDMQVLYPDLNWATLIATDGWIDTLGEYTSSFASGNYVSSGNSANITAVGIVMSEFFLSVASESETGYSEYEYSSVYDSDTIKALMLSLVGESEYEQLVLQAEIFTEMFNYAFASILEDIADDMNIAVSSNFIDNYYISMYKNFLTTVMMSSDYGEYLYTIASRVYAQYTINEALAIASGSYGDYYNYINGYTDENGDVTTFAYSSFKELVEYENLSIGTGAPTYSFNYNNALSALNATRSDSNKITETNKYDNFDDVLEYLEEYYESIYLTGDYEGRVESTDPLYCYMLDVYYSILQNLHSRGITSVPDYLELYFDYINGDIDRWEYATNVADISGASSYMQYYSLYNASLQVYKALYIVNFALLYATNGWTASVSIDTDDSDNIIDFFSGISVEVATPAGVLKELFGNDSSVFNDDYKNIFSQPLYSAFIYLQASENNGFSLFDVSGEEGWTSINNIYTSLGNILNELALLLEIEVGETTENGTTKISTDSITNDYYETVYNTVSNVYSSLGSYLSMQNVIDMAQKGAITFTLAQYSQNYVEDGFQLSFNNKEYTINSAISAQRLAEYVLGGAYLESYGVSAVYTSSDFEGIIQKTMVYDSSSNSVKGSLNIWSSLRTFAVNLADFTADLYYLTNFSELSANVNDAILMTDYIYEYSSGNTVTQEYLVLLYLISLSEENSDAYISADTLIRLSVAETSTDGTSGNVQTLIKYVLGTLTETETLTDSTKLSWLKSYLSYVLGDSYSGSYKSQSGGSTGSGRIHIIFKNVMTYLSLTSDSDEDDIDQAIEGKTYTFDNISFKDLRITLMDAISNYQQNESETAEDNVRRYLTLFKLLSCNFEYYVGADSTNVSYVGMHIVQGNLDSSKDVLQYTDGTGSTSNIYIYAKLYQDSTTEGIIKTLASVENRPIEELVGLEYGEVYATNGNYDEASGDTFVVCSYDSTTGKYIPFLTRNSSSTIKDNDEKYIAYLEEYKYEFTTNYYPSSASYAYPIIAKGIITSDGLPTAIKIVDNEVIFYRDGVTVTTSLGDNNQEASIVMEVGTINYTVFTGLNAFSSTSSPTTMYIGATNMDAILNSDTDVTYVQYTTEYNLEKVDENDGLSVLDSIYEYYNVGGMSHLLICLSFLIVIPILFNASMVVMRRIIDLMLLALEGPLVTAMTSLDYDFDKNTAFDTWKSQLIKTLLSAFGLVLGLNIYYILISAIMNMDSFVTANDITMQKIDSLGFSFSFISAEFLNSVIKALFILTAVAMIKRGANLLSSIITNISGSAVKDAFVSQLSNKSPVESVKGIVNDSVGSLKKAGSLASSVYTGKILVQAKHLAIQSVRKALPGGEILQRGIDGVRNVKNYAKSKALEALLRSKGVPKDMAKQIAAEFREEMKRQRDAKRAHSVNQANQLARTLNLSELDDPTKGSQERMKNREEKRQYKRNKLKVKANKQHKKEQKQNKKSSK